jgi:hypothetical protein
MRPSSISDGRPDSLKHLAPVSLALGIVYGVVMATQLFGFIAAQTQRFGLIQTYSFLSILGGLGIAATGFIEVVVHFIFKNDLIDECANLANGEVVFYVGAPFSSSEQVVQTPTGMGPLWSQSLRHARRGGSAILSVPSFFGRTLD